MKTYSGLTGYTYKTDDKPVSKASDGYEYELIGHPDKIAKIYNPQSRNTSLEEKLLAMLKFLPRAAEYCSWPIDALYENGKFAGCVKSKFAGMEKLRKYYANKNRKNYPWTLYIAIAKNLSLAVYHIHESGQITGDLNHDIILIDPKAGSVMLTDAEHYHIVDSAGFIHRCVRGMPEYIAPELEGLSLASSPLPTFTVETDLFSLSVLVFSLLINGAHPITSRENLLKGVSAYFPESSYSDTKISHYSPGLDSLPDELYTLFRRTFVSGHTDPSLRPSAEEYYYALEYLENNIMNCSVNSSHKYYAQAAECPWCKIEGRKRPDLKAGAITPLPHDTPETGLPVEQFIKNDTHHRDIEQPIEIDPRLKMFGQPVELDPRLKMPEQPIELDPRLEMPEQPIELDPRPKMLEQPIELDPRPGILEQPIELDPHPEMSGQPIEFAPRPQIPEQPIEFDPLPKIPEQPIEFDPLSKMPEQPIEFDPHPRMLEQPIELNPHNRMFEQPTDVSYPMPHDRIAEHITHSTPYDPHPQTPMPSYAHEDTSWRSYSPVDSHSMVENKKLSIALIALITVLVLGGTVLISLALLRGGAGSGGDNTDEYYSSIISEETDQSSDPPSQPTDTEEPLPTIDSTPEDEPLPSQDPIAEEEHLPLPGSDPEDSSGFDDTNSGDALTTDSHVYLIDLEFVNASSEFGGFWNYAFVQDNMGNTYDNGLGGIDAMSDNFQDYDINGAFSTISGTIVLNFDFRLMINFETVARIYGDGELLYESPLITAGVGPVPFSVDIRDVDVLRVSIFGQHMIRIVDCILY